MSEPTHPSSAHGTPTVGFPGVCDAELLQMTAIPFNLEIVDIQAVADEYGTPAHFVRVQWLETRTDA